MSRLVTDMVRRARLPKTIRRRPLAKAVLLALADRCHDDGCNAFLSMGNVATEVESSERLMPAVCRDLEAHGLIAEQLPPGQHRPRTWRLELTALEALSGPQHVADLRRRTVTAAPQHAADLTAATGRQEPRSGPQIQSSGPQLSRSAPHILRSAPQHAADDPLNLDPVLEPKTAAAPRSSPTDLTTAPAADGNYRVVRRLAYAVLDELGLIDEADLVEAVKRRCATQHIDYGRAVRPDVVHRACASARAGRVINKQASD